MLKAFFVDQHTLAAVSVALCLLAAGITYFFGRSRLPYPRSSALLLASLVGVPCLAFSGSSRTALRTCTFNWQPTGAFLSDQGLLNAVLFLAVGFFGLLASRRPVAVTAGASALSATVEVAQAMVPPLAQTCEASDFVASTAGALLGMLAAWATVHISQSAPVSFRHHPRSVVWVISAAFALNATTVALWVTPAVNDSSIQYVTPDMRKAARTHVRQAFGDHYKIGKISYDPTAHIVYVGLKGGMAHLSWPKQREFNVSLVSYQKGIQPADVGSFPVGGEVKPPAKETDARGIARRYVAERYPFALKGSKVESYAIADGRLGWAFSWRKVVNGILMPMRLDIAIDLKGQVSDLLVRDLADPDELPKPKLTEAQAKSNLRKSPGLPSEVTQIGDGLAIARSDTGKEWQVVWLFPTGVGNKEGPTLAVDAVTGKPLEEGQASAAP
ncbi:VanZ family protein [Streptomyces chryseus]|uniref:VanZ-like domain-containing protein n=1 Tax=Streptomyces chryseus TaxID=68186 RepID=A0ABQ3DX74_9ACTN|nr:VanZ family protein [Streptomyces chryseus]GHB16484.1 hypothetical protein GCM10010346_45440 [Streptomyces chryseus]